MVHDMTTDRQKIQVYLDQETFSVITELADALGVTRSAAVRGVLEDAVPMFRVVIDAARAVQGASEARKQAFGEVADRLAVKHSAAAEDLQADIVDLANRVKRAKVADARRAEGLPPSNRGVTR